MAEAIEEPKVEAEDPRPIPETEPDIPKRDDTPSIIDQAKSSGWDAGYYHFGKLEDQGNDFFNPGLVEREDGLWLLVRVSGLHPGGFMYGQNRLIAFLLDETGKVPKMGKILQWPVENPLQHFEDPRGFYHSSLQQTIIGACTFMWDGPGDWTGALQVMGAFDSDWQCKKMDYPKIGANPGQMEKIKPPYEKNWIWWLHEDRLHLLYKANPWTVYMFDGRWSERTDYKIKGITWNWGEIRGGTTPVLVGDMYFTFHHSSLPWKGRYRRYYAGALAFDAFPPFKPRLITPEPILTGSQNDPWAQKKPLVVFPCGSVLRDGKWLVSCGINDLKSAWLELSHDQLLERMRPVDEVSGTIFVGIPNNLSGGVESRHAELVEPFITDAPSSNSAGGGDADSQVSAQALTGLHSETSDSPAQTLSKPKRQFTEEQLAGLRSNAAKARAAKAAKKAAANVIGTAIKEAWESGIRQDYEKIVGKPKRRKRRRRSRTAEEKLQAVEDYKKKVEIRDSPSNS